jgi:fructose-1,6-bisphosphatase/inositol monophosphatase family enzyme
LENLLDLFDDLDARALEASRNPRFEVKPDGSLVTSTDREIEEILREKLPPLAPGAAIWGEELGYEAPTDAGQWLIDPIDGTSNFIYGVPLWGVTAAYYRDGKIVAGVISLPALGQRLWASDGEGAFLNGNRMPQVKTGPIKPYELIGHNQASSAKETRWPGKSRHLGSFVAEFAMFAQGSLRAMTSTRVMLYDAAAGIVIAREVGAVIKHHDHRDFDESEWVRPVRVEPFVFLPPDSGLL